MTKLLNKFFIKYFCPHPVVKASPYATAKWNYYNSIKVECSICQKVYYKKGRDLFLSKYKEKVCFYEAPK